MIYILYRKTNYSDGDGGANSTNRLYATSDLMTIFTQENYDKLLEYQRDYCDQDEYDNESDSGHYFFYFILSVKLDTLDILSKNDGRCFNDPKNCANGVFEGTLSEFKIVVDTQTIVKSKNKYRDPWPISSELAAFLEESDNVDLTLKQLTQKIRKFIDVQGLWVKKSHSDVLDQTHPKVIRLKEILNIPEDSNRDITRLVITNCISQYFLKNTLP